MITKKNKGISLSLLGITQKDSGQIATWYVSFDWGFLLDQPASFPPPTHFNPRMCLALNEVRAQKTVQIASEESFGSGESEKIGDSQFLIREKLDAAMRDHKKVLQSKLRKIIRALGMADAFLNQNEMEL